MSSDIVVMSAEELERRIEAAVARGLAQAAPRPVDEGSGLPSLVPIADAAKFLRVTARTVSRMLSDGRLTPVRSGGIVRVRRAQLLAFGGGA